MQQENEFMKEQMRMLEGQMDTEKRRREDAESEINKQKQVSWRNIIIELSDLLFD